MFKGKTVLISNDDGIFSKGIYYLAKALHEKNAEVYVCAPSEERSASSHAISLREPLRMTEINKSFGHWYAVSGTPADSTYMGLFHVLKNNPPFFVFSGINNGLNLGTDIFYSGTFAAAAESAIRGFPSMAVSVEFGSKDEIFESAAFYAVKIAEKLLKKPTPERIVFNFNYPSVKIPCGLKITTLGKRIYDDKVDERIDPKGRKYYWIGGGQINDKNIATASEYEALKSDKISLTPVDLRCGLSMKFDDFQSELQKVEKDFSTNE